jgi:CheY-like chemotaxis protein
MLSGTLNLDHCVVTHMESPAERKWTTLRNIASPQEKSPGEVVEPVVPELPDDEVGEPAEANSEPDAPGIPAPVRVPSGPVEVLIAHPVASTARLIRETLENFTDCRVVTTSDPLRAFELALQKRFGLFLFAMQTGELSGPMLYELISKACTAGRGPRLLAPAVIFVREKDDPKLPEVLTRDARVRDVLNKPIRIERLLQAVEGILEVRDPTVR